ncbi:MAG: ABC transporter substrate-binding protein [Candidatus Eisenbacteria bacterium]|nr:ABC transporter substrate-binding protein [Candidatus Eisenbacteria bacterium]
MRKTLVILSLLLSAFSCQPALREPIRIGLDIRPAYSLLFLVEEKGFFKDEGIDVEIIEFLSPHDSRVALEKGNVDVSLTTMVDAEILASRGTRVSIPFVIDYSYGGAGIVARSGITSLKDLRGKRVGLENASLGHFTLTRALEKSGVQASELELVDISPPEAEKMFNDGTLDAAVTWEPFLSRMAKGRGTLLFTSREIPWEIVDVICFRQDVTEKNPNVVPAILKAWLRALSYWRKHPAEASLIMAECMNVKPEEFSVGLNGVNVLDLRLNLAAFGMENMPGPLYETADHVSQTLYSIGMTDKRVSSNMILDRKPLLDLLTKGVLWVESLTK